MVHNMHTALSHVLNESSRRNTNIVSILTAVSSRWTWVSQYQNVSILDFIVAEDEGSGGDKSSPPTNQHPDFINYHK